MSQCLFKERCQTMALVPSRVKPRQSGHAAAPGAFIFSHCSVQQPPSTRWVSTGPSKGWFSTPAGQHRRRTARDRWEAGEARDAQEAEEPASEPREGAESKPETERKIVLSQHIQLQTHSTHWPCSELEIKRVLSRVVNKSALNEHATLNKISGNIVYIQTLQVHAKSDQRLKSKTSNEPFSRLYLRRLFFSFIILMNVDKYPSFTDNTKNIKGSPSTVVYSRHLLYTCFI